MLEEKSEEVIALILDRSETALSEAIRLMYKYQQNLRYAFKRDFNLSSHEITEAHDEAILSFIKEVRGGRFRGEAQVDTYFYTILKNKCTNMIRKRSSQSSTRVMVDLPSDLPGPVTTLVTSILERNEVAASLRYLIKKLRGKNCQGILTDFYYYGFSMEGICEKYGYQNPNAANTKKNTCMNELKNFIQKKTLSNISQ